MDEAFGEKIRKLREYNNMTQEELGKRINVGRDAIIRIEKGIRKVSKDEIEKLSKVFDMSVNDLIKEDAKITEMKGIILAGGSGTRLYPITEATSKQLIAIYDKPMIYYPLYVLMQSNIKDILIITTREDQDNFKRLLGDGSKYGINLSYLIQERPEGLTQAFIIGKDFIGDSPCAMVLGDNIFFGNEFEKELNQAVINASNGYATIFGYKVKDPQRFGIMELDKENNVLSVEEKPLNPKSDYAITGLYFYPSMVSQKASLVKPSNRGELEITTLNDMYLQEGVLKARLLGEGFSWFDTGTFESMLDASNMIRTLEKNKDVVICCPEALAYKKGWLNKEKMQERAELLKKNSYGAYLTKVLERTK